MKARVLLAIGLLAASVSTLAACSSIPSETSPSAGAWKDTVLAAAKTAMSDFARSVLSDGQITASEYRESVTRWVNCMQDLGFTAEATERPDGTMQYKTEADKDSVDSEAAAHQKCSDEAGLQIIESLYTTIKANPQKADQSDQIAQCFVKHDLVKAPFSGDDYKKAMQETAQGGTPPWKTDSVDYFNCMNNPKS